MDKILWPGFAVILIKLKDNPLNKNQSLSIIWCGLFN